MRLLAAFLAVALLFTVQPLRSASGETARAGDPLPSSRQNHAPGSVVRFEHFTVQDGLSQNAVPVIFQDSRGFLWIGTQDGLNRYDGYSFSVFKHDRENKDSISHNSILAIAEDNDGFLWIGTHGGGLNRFDPTTEKFTPYRNSPGKPSSLSDDVVTSLLVDSSGTLWAGTLNGLNRFNARTNGFDRFSNQPTDRASLSSNVISVIFEDSWHQLWIGTGALGIPGSGLNRLDPSTGKATRFAHSNSDPASLASNNISAIYAALDGNLWIGTGGHDLPGGGLDWFNPRTGTALHYRHDEANEDSLSGNDIASLWGDPNGALWVGTWSHGLNRMDFATPGRFTRYSHDPYFADSISGDDISSLFKDQSGVLWIGTTRNGLNKLPASSGQFNLYRNNPRNPGSLGINSVGAFSEGLYGDIWIGTWGGGLERFDPLHGDFQHFRHDPDRPNSLSSDLVTTVYADSQSNIWAGTLGGGLNRIEQASGKVTRYFHDPLNPLSLPDNNVTIIIPDGPGGLWVGTFAGLSHYDLSTNTFKNYVNDPAKRNSLSENKILSLYLDASEKILWIGTGYGSLNRLDLKEASSSDPQKAEFRSYRYGSGNRSNLREDAVWAIHESGDGYLWLGTQSGLNRFSLQTHTFRQYTEKEGLPNSSVLGILQDDQNCLWLTTSNGLAKFDLLSRKFTTYDSSNGLQSNEFNSNAYFRAHDGTMYIGGVNGFNTFDPASIHVNSVPPPVAITDFEVDNQPLKLDLSGKQPIRLTYQQDFLTFEFAALDFGTPQKNHYAYMLEGFDKNWTQTKDRRYVTYTNLRGGEYVFRVKAANSDGVWNETGISIPIVITPPIWEMWWFQGLVVAALMLVTAVGVRWRLSTIQAQKTTLERQVAIRTAELQQQIEQREKAEQALAEKAAQEAVMIERTRLARDLHDAVTQTLFSASLIAEVLPDIWKMNPNEAWKRLEELRQLTRGALAEMRTLLIELRPSALTEIPLPDLMRQLCESLIGRARLPIQLCVEGTQKLPPDLQIGLYRIAQEALNNIIKHARATEVLVTLRLKESVCLSIVDNGSGFDLASVSPDHLGLKIMRERAEAIGAQLSVYSQPGEGTQISILWNPPLQHSWQPSPPQPVGNNVKE